MTKAKTFDLEKVYDEEIFPLMEKIVRVCKDNHLPMFASFLYRSDPEGIDDGEDRYCTTSLHYDDHRQSEELAKAQAILTARQRRAFRITVRDGNGNVTRDEVHLD